MSEVATSVEELESLHKELLPEFNELVSFAVDACLRDPALFKLHLQDIEIEVNGSNVWAVRAEIELDSNGTLYEDEDEAPDHEEAWNYERIKDEAGDFIPAPNFEVQTQIEAFGRALLDEAFLCLGKDAKAQAEKMRMAKTFSEQVEIINWLIYRIRELKRSAEYADLSPKKENPDTEVISIETGRTAIYHPIRLSPKAIGEFPDTKVDPTCLGTSILVSSFFHVAGMEHLHAGTMRTARDMSRVILLQMGYRIEYFAESHGGGLSEATTSYIDNLERINDEVIDKGTDLHDCTLVKLVNGQWVMVDINYKHFIGADALESMAITDEQKRLEQSQDRVLGAELGSFNPYTGVTNHVMIRRIQMLTDNLDDINIVGDDLDKILESHDLVDAAADYTLAKIVSVDQAIADEFKQLLDELPDEEVDDVSEQELKRADRYCDDEFDDLMDFANVPAKYDYVMSKLESVVKTHLFKDKPEIVRSRVASDPEYRRRRIEDLRMIPSIFALGIMSDAIRRQTENYVHLYPSMELGMPEYRIGATVLNDFALYTEANLPFSFWASNWASYVTFANNMPGYEDRHQRAVLARLLEASDSSFLSYLSTRGIIREFLEQEYQEV